MTKNAVSMSRRSFGGLAAGLVVAGLQTRAATAAAPDGAGAVADMMAALQASAALSFSTQSTFGASVAKDRLLTLGSRAHVVFQRPDTIFAVFGAGGEPDVQLLIAGRQATLYRLSLAAKTVLPLDPANGAAFAVPGLFLPMLGLLAGDIDAEMFGGIQSVTPIAQAGPDQPEETTLAAVMGKRFTGEVWVDKSSGRPTRVTGTWFGGKGDVAESAVVNLSDWSSEAPVAGAFAVKGLAEAKSVALGDLGL